MLPFFASLLRPRGAVVGLGERPWLSDRALPSFRLIPLRHPSSEEPSSEGIGNLAKISLRYFDVQPSIIALVRSTLIVTAKQEN